MAEYRDKYSTETYSEFIDPSLREAVNNIATASSRETNPELAIQKGQLKIQETPKFSSGSAINEAIMNRARAKFNDPQMSSEMQKLRYVTNQADRLQNSANQVMSIYKLDQQAANIAKERKAAEESQRAQVLSSVLGLGGAVVGGLYGGPAGAAAGGAVGGEAGKSLSK